MVNMAASLAYIARSISAKLEMSLIKTLNRVVTNEQGFGEPQR